MPEAEKIYESVRKAILAVYAKPTDRPGLINLARHVQEWDELDFVEKESEGHKIFEELQSLSAFLENKGLSAQSDEVFRLILHTFPEKYFPSLPWLKDSKDVDLSLLDDARFVLESRNYPDYVQESFRLFDEQFRKANRSLPVFVKELELNLFNEKGSGITGELFRRFADVADKLYSSTLKDVPWTLMNQLAMKLNNSMNAFNAAYILLKGLDEVRVARPSPALRDSMRKNEDFFLRNYYWKCIDDATAKEDYSNVVFYIDKFLPMIETGYERSNLLMLRENALKKINEIPKGCITYTILAFTVLIVISILASEPEIKKNLNLDRTREEILTPKKDRDDGIKVESKIDDQQLEEALEVKSRTGLREKKPPVRPHNRKLNLYEIRHVIFQKMRLDYLAGQKLDDDERKQLEILLEDYKSRCEFYQYDNDVREKVHWDAKIHAPRIIQDAQDILNSWKKKHEQPDVQEIVSKQLLNLSNPQHVRLIIQRLKMYGYYKEKDIPKTWTESARRALLDFKVSNLGIVNSEWNMETQNALFGNY
ncbi:MAG: hypothetical protein Kow0029_08930 [Candidatus Rifleibacteriota bacterium]